MAGKTLKNKCLESVKIQERCLRIKADMEVLEGDSGCPPGMRPYKAPVQTTGLSTTYSKCETDAYYINIVLDKNLSRGEALALPHHRVALEVSS